MSTAKVRDDAYDILVPAAEKFRQEVLNKKEPFNLIMKYNACRVKFTTKKSEKEWQKYCQENNLPNDTSVEY